MFVKADLSQRFTGSKAALLILVLAMAITGSRMHADTGSCGGQTFTLPFNDVMGNLFFCQISEIYFQGITSGTTPTTYSPSSNVTRDQMAAFLGRTLDTGLKRGSQRAALDQFWTTTPHYDLEFGTTMLTGQLELARSDGQDVWVPASGNVFRVQASDGKLLDTWTGATNAYGVLCAMGRVFITGDISPAGSLYMIDPAAPAGAVTTLTTGLGTLSTDIGFDGSRIWTANSLSLSIVTPGPTIPWGVTTVTGFGRLVGFIYDGSNMWVTDTGGGGALKKLDVNGNVLQTVIVGPSPNFPGFDGKNIWVPTSGNTLVVVRASTGEILATLTGNGLNNPRVAAFDGERILVTNFTGDSISLWKASDLTPIGTFSTGAGSIPFGVCSDRKNFWIALQSTSRLARF